MARISGDHRNESCSWCALSVPDGGHAVAIRPGADLADKEFARGPAGGMLQQVGPHGPVGVDGLEQFLGVHPDPVRLGGIPRGIPGIADADGDQALDVHFVGVHQQPDDHLRVILLPEQIGEKDHAMVVPGGLQLLPGCSEKCRDNEHGDPQDRVTNKPGRGKLQKLHRVP